MWYVSSTEKAGFGKGCKEGRDEGRKEGLREGVLRGLTQILELRVPDHVRAELIGLDHTRLLELVEAAATAGTLAGFSERIASAARWPSTVARGAGAGVEPAMTGIGARCADRCATPHPFRYGTRQGTSRAKLGPRVLANLHQS